MPHGRNPFLVFKAMAADAAANGALSVKEDFTPSRMAREERPGRATSKLTGRAFPATISIGVTARSIAEINS